MHFLSLSLLTLYKGEVLDSAFLSCNNLSNKLKKGQEERYKANQHSKQRMVSSTNSSLILFFASSLFLHGLLAELICENLPSDLCAFAIASSGKRCVLENYRDDDGTLEYTCKTSEVVVARLSGYIETDQCVKACGVDRGFVGISSDAFFTADFTSRLCSPACYQNCPNIVDLYFNLAAGEGVFLPALCEKQKANPHRAMLELLSSGGAGGAAPGPVAADLAVDGPSPAPSPLSF